MTYHSSKGLDFETVFIPGLDENYTIFNRNDEAMDRRLFYVAATRSRRNLFISYTGTTPHPFVANMPQDLLDKMVISSASTAGQTSQNNNDYY
jgi:superfamily I DNA/RNA helicase